MDKWVPTICIISAISIAYFAYFLYSTQMSVASDTNTTSNLKEEIPQKESEQKIKILLVPGHDKNDYGADFRDLTEQEINLELSQKIKELLSKDEKFEIFVTRESGDYTAEFQNYFENQKEQILNFIDEKKNQTEELTESGIYEPILVVEHNPVPNEVALKLYGINKWVNENEIDLVLHIHFNDYPRKNRKEIGKYNGFSIYIPSDGLVGNEKSKELANKIRDNLSKYFNESNLPVEKDIVIENSELIAVGSNNTIESAASILVEYGYIYEDHFYDKEKRSQTLNTAANQTYLAINDLF